MNSTLDLRWQKTDYSAFFSETEFESLVEEFSSSIALCNRLFARNLDWWFEPLSARNNFGSPLLHHFLCFHLCLKLAKAKRFPRRCLTDCDVLQRGLLILQADGRWDGDVVHTRKRSHLGLLVKRLRAFGRVTASVLFPFLLLGFRNLRQHRIRQAPTILVDTFVLPGKEEVDRYYAGVFEFLTPEERSAIRLVPTFHGYSPKQYFATLRLLAGQTDRFLFKESFLRVGDYVHALAHALRVFFLRPPSTPVGPFDLGRLIREEVGRFGGLEDAVHGFLNFAFAKRLREAGVRPEHVVDWHENHGRDRGWNLGFHRFHPGIARIGFAPGSLSQWHLAATPLPSERRAGVLPDVLLTPSRHLAKAARAADPALQTETTGAFRFAPPQVRAKRRRGPIRLLAPLSYDPELARDCCRRIRTLLREVDDEEFIIVYKTHPATNHLSLEALKTECSSGKESWTSRPFSEELELADAVLGSWTTALLEAVNAGVPAGLLRSPDGLFHNPIPPGAADEWTFRVDSFNTLAPLLAFTRKQRCSPHPPPSHVLAPPSRKYALRLFGLPN